MTRLVPPVLTLIRVPERAAVAALAAVTALARNVLVAAHPISPASGPESPSAAPSAELRRLARLDRDLDLYVQAYSIDGSILLSHWSSTLRWARGRRSRGRVGPSLRLTVAPRHIAPLAAHRGVVVRSRVRRRGGGAGLKTQ